MSTEDDCSLQTIVGRNDQHREQCFLDLDDLMFTRQYALMMLGRSSSVSTKMSFSQAGANIWDLNQKSVDLICFFQNVEAGNGLIPHCGYTDCSAE